MRVIPHRTTPHTVCRNYVDSPQGITTISLSDSAERKRETETNKKKIPPDFMTYHLISNPL